MIDVDAMDGTESSRSGSSTLFVAPAVTPSRVFDASRACFGWSHRWNHLSRFEGLAPVRRGWTCEARRGTLQRVNGPCRDTEVDGLIPARAPHRLSPATCISHLVALSDGAGRVCSTWEARRDKGAPRCARFELSELAGFARAQFADAGSGWATKWVSWTSSSPYQSVNICLITAPSRSHGGDLTRHRQQAAAQSSAMALGDGIVDTTWSLATHD